MIEALRALRKKYVVGFVGGSDFVKIEEQLKAGDANGEHYSCNYSAIELIQASSHR